MKTKYIAIILLFILVFSACAGNNQKTTTKAETSTITTAKPEPLSGEALVKKFLSSLKNGDIDEVKQIIGTKDSNFDFLKTVKVDSYSYEKATDTEVYNVELNVKESGFDKIPTGESRWGFYDDPQYGPRFYQIGANDRTLSKAEQLARWYVNFEDVPFDKPTSLNPDIIADAVLGLSFKFDNNTDEVLSTAEFKAAAKKYFGLINFEAKDSPNYDKKTGRYSNIGHGGNEYSWDTSATVSGDTATIKVTYYHEPSNFSEKGTREMILKQNADKKSWRIISFK